MRVRSSTEPVVGGESIDRALHAVGGSSGQGTLQTPNAPIAKARGFLIYLRNRGVLNVEEFRRTNTRRL